MYASVLVSVCTYPGVTVADCLTNIFSPPHVCSGRLACFWRIGSQCPSTDAGIPCLALERHHNPFTECACQPAHPWHRFRKPCLLDSTTCFIQACPAARLTPQLTCIATLTAACAECAVSFYPGGPKGQCVPCVHGATTPAQSLSCGMCVHAYNTLPHLIHGMHTWTSLSAACFLLRCSTCSAQGAGVS